VWLDRVGDGSRLKLALNNWLVVLVEAMSKHWRSAKHSAWSRANSWRPSLRGHWRRCTRWPGARCSTRTSPYGTR
jgi:hypothetical protein